MKLNIFLIFALLTIFVCGLQLAEPAAAAKAKLIDQGSHVTKNNNSTYKTTWKTYQYNKNHIVVKIKNYLNGKLSPLYSTVTITKYSKKIVCLVYLDQGCKKNTDKLNTFLYSKVTDYRKYSPTARTYYFKKIKPTMV